MTRLVLFDIDGTLLWTDGAGRRAIHTALREIFGGIGPQDYWFDGKTDREIVRHLMRIEGHDDTIIDGRMERLLERYVECLEQELADREHLPRPLDGVLPLLDALEEQDLLVLGLLTGNVEAGAAAKLRAVGIDPARFRIGAFGSDHEHRPELPAVALRRMQERFAIEVPTRHMVIVGDTPADIDCGVRIGARTVGVATGRYSVEQLTEHRADAVLPDFRDLERALQAILDA